MDAQTLQGDRLIAVDAIAVGAGLKPAQCRPYLVQLCEVALFIGASNRGVGCLGRDISDVTGFPVARVATAGQFGVTHLGFQNLQPAQ